MRRRTDRPLTRNKGVARTYPYQVPNLSNLSPLNTEGERIAIARRPRLAGVEVKTVSQATSLWRVLHEKYALVSPVAGTSCRVFRGKHISRSPGELMFYEPGDFDTNTHIDRGSVFHVVSVEARVLEPTLSLASGKRDWRIRDSEITSLTLAAAVRAFAEAMHASHDEFAIDEVFARLAGELADHHLADTQSRRTGNTRGEQRAIARLCEQLHTQLHDVPSLDELALEVGLDKYQVIRLFKAYYGTTPYAYRNALRVARARAMLRRDRKPSEVGALLGFADFSHFRRTFVKYVGLTPSQYRRALEG
jgi:AraC-like DNA-binding protein